MKKVLISMMLVVLTLCLFVSCSSSPKVKEEPTPITLTIKDMKKSQSGTVTLNGPTLLKDITTIEINGNDKTICYSTDMFKMGMGGIGFWDLCTDSNCEYPITDINYRISENITLYYYSTPV